jgi:hypothetical protein
MADIQIALYLCLLKLILPKQIILTFLQVKDWFFASQQNKYYLSLNKNFIWGLDEVNFVFRQV